MVVNAYTENTMPDCKHKEIELLNPYEYIRKYRCNECGNVMMCNCDEYFARKYLPHQISEATELETKKRVPVTIGFQKNICDKCRGLPEKAYSIAEIYGRESKIKRYYWREIAFETIKRFENWSQNEGYTDWLEAMLVHKEVHKKIERQVVKEINELHKTAPKYTYEEESQSEIISKYNVEVINLDGVYVKSPGRKVSILRGKNMYSAEEYVRLYLNELGFNVLETESVPFHVIFGVFMWLLIQDPADELNRLASFGDRNAFENKTEGKLISTFLPEDFGSSGYYKRREDAIKAHLDTIPEDREDLFWTFDYWIDHSSDFRQYLWAHRQSDIGTARKILSILPPETIKRILMFLIQNYYHRYLGWPDLLVFRDEQFFFAEIKSSNDKLRGDQKDWISNNSLYLKLPFKVYKIHKKAQFNSIEEAQSANIGFHRKAL
jgi:VRR-NUC domain-containing protein